MAISRPAGVGEVEPSLRLTRLTAGLDRLVERARESLGGPAQPVEPPDEEQMLETSPRLTRCISPREGGPLLVRAGEAILIEEGSLSCCALAHRSRSGL